jgi:hypothetical protein
MTGGTITPGGGMEQTNVLTQGIAG